MTDAVDELTALSSDVVRTLSAMDKAALLLKQAIAMIESRQYGPKVEKLFEVYLKTPGLSNEQLKRAYLARGNARKEAGEALVAGANQDFEAVLKLDPSQSTLRSHLRWFKETQHRPCLPPSQRAPLEVWDRIAHHIPRYHLRTWLFLSSFHRSIAHRIIFHTLDLHLGEDTDLVNRCLDIFDRARSDPIFGSRVRCLRLHWAYEEGDMCDLMMRLCRGAFDAFARLEEFEWVGYPEMRAEMVRGLLGSGKVIKKLGLIGWHFDAVGVSSFTSLTKFTLRAEDDDGFASMSEVRLVLDNNHTTLKHLILGAYLARNHSWDTAFQSHTIGNLRCLDLVDTRISGFVFGRVMNAERLESLTLHGALEDPGGAEVLFGSDYAVEASDGSGWVHSLLPSLTSFRFLLVEHDEDTALYASVARFVRNRRSLRRLDLGNCPFELVFDVLPGLTGLRALGITMGQATRSRVDEIVRRIPECVGAVRLSVAGCDVPLHHLAHSFTSLPSLSFLHLHSPARRPTPTTMSDKEYQIQTEIWLEGARSVATWLKGLDFVGWNGEHYVVVRNDQPTVQAQAHIQAQAQTQASVQIATSSDSPIDLDAIPDPETKPPSQHQHQHQQRSSGQDWPYQTRCGPSARAVELKELPSRRRLDCGKGVDLGSEDAMWVERKDVPMDYEMAGIE